MAELFLGFDVGSYSSKGVLTRFDGTVLKTHVVKHTIEVPRPGWAEQDADGVWWGDVQAICRALLDGGPCTGADVAGLPFDTQGRPLRGILYGVDTRAGDEIDLLNRGLGEEVFPFSGMAFTSQAVGPKILWIKRHKPDV